MLLPDISPPSISLVDVLREARAQAFTLEKSARLYANALDVIIANAGHGGELGEDFTLLALVNQHSDLLADQCKRLTQGERKRIINAVHARGLRLALGGESNE